MEDAWRSKWPPPPPPPLPPPASLPPLPPVAAPSQFNMNLRHLVHPFIAQEATADKQAIIEEQLVPNPFSLQFGQSGKIESSNSFLAQMSGNYSHVPNSKKLVHKLNASEIGNANDSTCASQLTSSTPLLKYYGPGTLAISYEHSSRPLSLTKTSNLRSIFPGEGSTIDGLHEGPILFQSSKAQVQQKLPSESTSHRHPAFCRDRLVVSCMNTGGELFVGEAGLFGVLCFCHLLKMSIAKFCEHSGASAEKAGEIVRMENGMPIAQWFQCCLGVGGSVTGTKWDWPEWTHARNSQDERRVEKSSTRNSYMEKVEAFGGSGKTTGPINKSIYSSDVYIEGGGCTTFEQLVSRPGETCYRRNVDVHNAFTKNANLQQSIENSKFTLARNHTMNAMNTNPASVVIGSPDMIANKGGSGDGDHLICNNANLFEKRLDASFLDARSSSKRGFSHDSRTRTLDTPQKVLEGSSGNASNIELKLGQPSYRQSTPAEFPSVHSMVIDFQKPQSHQPSITQNLCPWPITKVNRGIQEEHTKVPFPIVNKQQSLEVVNDVRCCEDGALTGDAAKNSLISLFLSHLERNSAFESADDILNSNEHWLPKVVDSVKCDLPRSTNEQFEPRATDNHLKVSASMVHSKQRSDHRALPTASDGNIPRNVPGANDQVSLIYGDCRPTSLPIEPDAAISKLCAEVSCPANCRSCNYLTDGSLQVARNETGIPFHYVDNTKSILRTSQHAHDLCTREKSREFFEISCPHGRSCCLSAQKLPPSFGQDDQSTLKKPIQGSYCRMHRDVSKVATKDGHLCQACSSGGTLMLTQNPVLEGPDECSTCSTSIPRSLLYSGEHYVRSSCCEYPIDEFHCTSSARHSVNNLVKNSSLEVTNRKEPGISWLRRCCYSLIPKCSSGCDFMKHCCVRADHTNLKIPINKSNVVIPEECCTLRLGETDKARLGLCRCSKNIIAGTSISQSSFCKENKVTNYSSHALSERSKNVADASMVVGNQLDGISIDIEGVQRDPGLLKDQVQSGISSGSFAPPVTDFSVSTEVNNSASCTAKYVDGPNDILIDEGSRIEKCASSSYEPVSTECEKDLHGLSKVHLDGSAKVKRKSNHVLSGCTVKENVKQKQHFEMSKKTRTLGSTKYSESCTYTGKISVSSSQVGASQPEGSSSSYKAARTKRRHPSIFLNKPVKRLRSHHQPSKGEHEQSDDEGILLGALNSSGRRKEIEDTTAGRRKEIEDTAALDRTKCKKEGHRVFARKLPKYLSLSCIAKEHDSGDACGERVEPMLCGNSSAIATGITNDNRRSPKIVSLSLILKKAKRCQSVELTSKTGKMLLSEEKNSVIPVNETLTFSRSSLHGREDCGPQVGDESQPSRKNVHLADAFKPCVGPQHNSDSALGENEPFGLMDAEKSPLLISTSRSSGMKHQSASLSLRRFKKYDELTDASACSSSGDKDETAQVCQVTVGRYNKRLDFLSCLDAPCCVCRSSTSEQFNEVIECSKCFIKVHQACYGVSKVPRGQWFCRPCKANAQDIVCVLCGYGGGAMTGALKTENIVKSLLEGLKIGARPDEYVHPSENTSDADYCTPILLGEDSKHEHDSLYASRSIGSSTVPTMNLQKPTNGVHWLKNIPSSLQNLRNLADSLLGRAQWVHVVCGLWTPGTRCPNVSTMSAFDISGASPARKNVACSVCNRLGGSFMECREMSCSALFHPWCAHQKDLLQSEPEGESNDSIGFYGRCLHHATKGDSTARNYDYAKVEHPTSKDWTCARAEGFKGRKSEDPPGTNYKKSQENSGGINVSQEQINAWLRINSGRGPVKPPLDVESDFRKEYIRYKHSKGWKHLVVYKSGIHALGLYTSQFIPRGAMVVEYVGEIVGLRVADKREIEYQSGRRQQYKSACYFFRIDKEHIIDATQKGGIARFVNHSCLPNCVAKVISIRTEKKVVFFAERDINPGGIKEITYDYHFNCEDEGQKIPCFCRSKNCRRYLN